MKHFVLSTLMLCFTQIAVAQNTSARIIDSKSGEIIPFANITIGTDNLISNSEGHFSVPDADSEVKIAVSCIGYIGKVINIGTLRSANNVVKLEPAMYQLENVSVTRPDAETIMKNVKQQLSKHYTNTIAVAKDLVFLRESTNFMPQKMDFEITESTGFSKKGLADANAELNAFSKMMKTHPPKSFTDKLCNLYLPAKSAPKLEVIKATRLRDENRATSFDQIEKTLGTTILKHLDTMKYYRIKSGWIGSRDTVSLRKDYKKKKNKIPTGELQSAKGHLVGFLIENSFLSGSTLNFVTTPELYEYKYDGATFMNNDELVYVLKFKPRKSKAKYTGTIYVSSEDYAVIRTDYALAKGKTEGGVNLKWILGIKASENVSNGTTIYKQNPSGEGYYLQYAAIETGQYFYLNRPLKFIELSAVDKDVVEFDIKVEGNMREKTEYLNISRSETNESALAAATEPEFKYTILKRYDPSIWAKYSAIEPLEEMKRFTVPE